jgi:hypothetical protein
LVVKGERAGDREAGDRRRLTSCLFPRVMNRAAIRGIHGRRIGRPDGLAFLSAFDLEELESSLVPLIFLPTIGLIALKLLQAPTVVKA